MHQRRAGAAINSTQFLRKGFMEGAVGYSIRAIRLRWLSWRQQMLAPVFLTNSGRLVGAPRAESHSVLLEPGPET